MATTPPSRINAELSLYLLPVLAGAVEVVDAGIVSTLQGQNERDNAAAVATAGGEGGEEGKSARFRLLFDPQVSEEWMATSGGYGWFCRRRRFFCAAFLSFFPLKSCFFFSLMKKKMYYFAHR